jgi:two-component system, chemotaxis family, protein-glutamate methylesterase/glutaminase
MKKTVRVLVVDDSALMRKLIPQIIERDMSIQVVGTAMDGQFALQKIRDLKPDVVTLDLEMPRMDGMKTLSAITQEHKIPTIVVSAHSTQGASATFKALALGAFDFVTKPRNAASAHMEEISNELIEKVKAAAQSGAPPAFLNRIAVSPLLRRKPAAHVEKQKPNKVVAIGVSTGGPNAVQYVLSQLPADFPAAILIVQHMPEGFTETFANRLNETCAISVKEAATGDVLTAGRALVAPGNRHMKVCHMSLGDTVLLTDDEKVNGHRPSCDVLFRSAAQIFKNQAIGVIMTGMGEDGADAIGEIKRTGGITFAQNEETCVVYGMPRAAIARGNITRVLPLEALANSLQVHCRSEKRAVDASEMQDVEQ